MRRSLLPLRSLLATAAERSMPTVTISARSSSGPPTSVWPYWRRPDRTSSCIALRDVQIAARHADPRTTTVYDRRRENFDRHAAYVVVAFVAGG